MTCPTCLGSGVYLDPVTGDYEPCFGYIDPVTAEEIPCILRRLPTVEEDARHALPS